MNEDGSLDIFSKAKFMVLIDAKNLEIIKKIENPTLVSRNKRPTFAKECVKQGASEVIAPHGSLCFPSYMILKRAGIEIYITETGSKLSDLKLWPVTWSEVFYSSAIATKERILEVFGKE